MEVIELLVGGYDFHVGSKDGVLPHIPADKKFSAICS